MEKKSFNTMEDFTNLYSLSKTLRFELKPVGKTAENIEKSGLLIQDQKRAADYQVAKKVIDIYHKYFIEESLKNLELKLKTTAKKDSLEEFYNLYLDKNAKKRNENLETIQENLRKQIAACFKKNDLWTNLFKKELIKKDLAPFLDRSLYKELLRNSDQKYEKLSDQNLEYEIQEQRKIIEGFDNFTTYFVGFHENRKNMYSAEDISTAIPYRIIQQNLPKFIDNMLVYENISKKLATEIATLSQELQNDLSVKNIKNIFSLKQYPKVVTQKQIDEYNLVLGGKSLNNGKKVKGLNEYINLYNQKHKDERLPKLKPLYKQILSDRHSVSFLPEKFKKDNEVLEALQKFYEEVKDILVKNEDKNLSLISLLANLENYDLAKIYLTNDTNLTSLSKNMFGSWDIFEQAVKNDYAQKNPITKKKNLEKYEDDKDKYFKSFDSFSIAYLNECLLRLDYLDYQESSSLESYFKNFKIKETDQTTLLKNIEKDYQCIEELLNTSYPENKKLIQDTKNIEKIKTFLDDLKKLQRFIKPLLGKGNEGDKDQKFYGDFIYLWLELDNVTSLYNKVRNYLTAKPYSEEKYKLNFDNSHFLNGWPHGNKNSSLGILFKDENFYYLGIENKIKNPKNINFDSLAKPKSKKDFFSKMNYYQVSKPGQNISNLMVKDGKTVKINGKKETIDGIETNPRLEEAKNTYLPENVNKIRIKKSYLVNEKNFNKKDLNIYLDYYKERTKEYYADYDFEFKNSFEYQSFADFAKHVNEQAYKIEFKEISREEIDELIEQNKLFLFKIWNKDFSPYSKGRPNMHTLYWKMLFEENNLKDVVYKLNGQAEMFYRKASLDNQKNTIHQSEYKIAKKTYYNPETKKTEHLDGETIKHLNLYYQGKLKGQLSETEKKYLDNYSTFKDKNLDIVKNKRYTEDKYLFHVPITINFKGLEKSNINYRVYDCLKNSKKTHVIGIDRGERHLLYLSVIDLQGNIVEQYTLNEIINQHKNKTYTTNYHDLLDQKEKERDQARKNWQTIENIKELKEGYLSQVVHKISELMIKYNAIVVLEDLNFGFMRGRQKVEKQVYQKFEKMLIDKLNYLVFKNEKDLAKAGSLLKAYQLTNKFESFQKMGKQNGFLFYIPAWMTSKIDPVTGFVSVFDTRYKSVNQAQNFFEKFAEIEYNSSKEYFQFLVNDYAQFNAKVADTKQDWLICSHGQRIKTYRDKKSGSWKNEEINLTAEFISLFEKNKIDYTEDLKEQILAKEDKEFFSSLLYLFKLTVQMRNSKTGTEIDYLISPVANEKGKFYDSRTCSKQLPKDADANGAYNIARKGLWVIEQIKEIPVGEEKKLKLAISNKEWLNFAQQKEYSK